MATGPHSKDAKMTNKVVLSKKDYAELFSYVELASFSFDEATAEQAKKYLLYLKNRYK